MHHACPMKAKQQMRHDLRAGTPVRLTKAVDLQPYTTLAAGERGIVTEVVRDPDGFVFAVEVLMLRLNMGLREWANHALLGREDVLDAVEVVTEVSAPPSQELCAA